MSDDISQEEGGSSSHTIRVIFRWDFEEGRKCLNIFVDSGSNLLCNLFYVELSAAGWTAKGARTCWLMRRMATSFLSVNSWNVASMVATGVST